MPWWADVVLARRVHTAGAVGVRTVKHLRMALENVLPFRERVAVPLCDVGLVMVQGRNEVSSCASSNGSGKTALVVDGPALALFGETLRGVRADDAACRFNRLPGRVTYDLMVGDEPVTVERQFRPSRLRVSNQSADLPIKELNLAVASMLGWGLQTYRNAVVFAQGAFERFAQADQRDQLRMLDEIQGLDLRAARDRAKAWRDDAAARLDELLASQARLDERARDLVKQLAEIGQQRARFEADKAARVAASREAVDAAAQAVVRRRAVVAECEKAVAAVKEVRRRVPSLRAEAALYAEAGRAVEMIKGYVREHEGARDRLRRAAGEKRVALDALLEHSACPTCREAFNPKKQKSVRARYLPEIDEADAQAEQQDQIVEVELENLTFADRHLAEVKVVTEQELGQFEERGSDRALARAGDALSRARLDLDQSQQGTRLADQALTRALAEEFSGARLDERLLADRLDCESKSVAMAPAIKRAEVTVAVADYWHEAFGDRGIRSLMFDSVAGFLNDRLARHLSLLAAGEASVTVSALSALKGGGAKERISVASEWAWGGGARDRGSAGQDRRVDLALFAALQDLAESRSARPFPFKVWDEPADSLDATGQELFARWVEREAGARGAGFLVTHSQQLAESVRASQTWTVAMRKDGATVEIASGFKIVDVLGRKGSG